MDGALNNKLTFPDGTDFYLDAQNGERGYNPDPARGADTFIPFNKGKIGLIIEQTTTMLTNNPAKRSGSVTCTRSGYIMIGAESSGNHTYNSSYCVKKNGVIIFNEVTNNNKIKSEFKVNKGDVISWDITAGASTYAAFMAITYPA